MIRPPPISTLFPYTTLFRFYRHGPPQPSWDLKLYLSIKILQYFMNEPARIEELQRMTSAPRKVINENMIVEELLLPNLFRDRKSTRLNSSHSQISYAVFCLK